MAIAVVFVVVVLLAAEVWAMVAVLLVELVVGIPDIGFELCGAGDLVPRRILRCSVNTELDCGEDSDCHCTDSMSSDGTDAISC